MRVLSLALLACAIVLTISTSANGVLLGLTSQPPDITSGFMLASYVTLDETLTVSGDAITIVDISDDVNNITNGTYNIAANIDSNGDLLADSTLTVGGTVPA